MTQIRIDGTVVAREGDRFLIATPGDDPHRDAYVVDLDTQEVTRKQPLQVWFKWANWTAADNADFEKVRNRAAD